MLSAARFLRFRLRRLVFRFPAQVTKMVSAVITSTIMAAMSATYFFCGLLVGYLWGGGDGLDDRNNVSEKKPTNKVCLSIASLPSISE